MSKISAIAAFIIALGIIAGAFGAHALKDSFSLYQEEIWKTAAFYQLINGIGLLFIGSIYNINADKVRLIAILMISGIFIFSGSLYCLALSNLKWLGAVTPIGGSLLIAAWLLLGTVFWRSK